MLVDSILFFQNAHISILSEMLNGGQYFLMENTSKSILSEMLFGDGDGCRKNGRD
jgi:hypothetical protein